MEILFGDSIAASDSQFSQRFKKKHETKPRVDRFTNPPPS